MIALIEILKNSDYGIDLINKVDSFYKSAWDKLLIFGTVSFAILGIIVPFIIQWYQKKTLKISEELLKKEIEVKTLKIKNEILTDINKNIENKFKIFDAKIDTLNASMIAKTFHLQANKHIAEKKIKDALSDYITCADSYLGCNDYPNLQNILSAISNICLPVLSLEEVEDLKLLNGTDLNAMLDKIVSEDEKFAFAQVVREIKFKISKLPKTIKEKNEN